MKRSLLLVIFSIILAAGIISAGCTTAPATGASISPYSGQSHSPADLNATIARFDAYAESARQAWNVPGMAIAIVKDGKIVFVKGYGVKTAGGSDPVTPDTVFQIGSTSKAFTAALAAMEVDSGRMNWNDPVIRYVPDFQMYDPWVTKEFTITDSLAQRSGLGDHWGMDLATVGYNRSEMIHALRYAQPVSSFRSQFMYQNVPFVVTGAAIEKTSGKSWEDNLQTRIFAPLHMTSASTSYAAFLASPDHVSLHTFGVKPDNTTGPVVTDPNWRFNSFAYDFGPAGGINADVKDMATWTIFQLGNGTFEGNQLISPENMAYMHTPRTPTANVMTDSKSYYCQGWIYQEFNGNPPIIWHNGETLGNHAMVLLVPSENMGIVILANEAGPSLPDALAFSFYGQYLGKANADVSTPYLKQFQDTNAALLAPQPVRPANAAPPLSFTHYTGSYADALYGAATVAEQDGNLTLTFGKKPLTFILSPWDGNTFTSGCPQCGQDYHGKVVFDTKPDGTVSQLTTTLFLEQGYNRNATFVRTGAA